MPLQALVAHKEELHRLIKGYFVAAQKLDPPGRANARHGRLHLIRIDALRIGAFEAADGIVREEFIQRVDALPVS